MKKSTIIISLLTMFVVSIGSAQGLVNSKLHALTDPVTNCELRYYYYFNIEAYYDCKKNVFLYRQDGQWTTADEIPSGYKGYSMSNQLNILINDYDGDEPTQFLSSHKKKYPYNTKIPKMKKATASVN